MAQYYAHIQGSRGPASRLGCKASGIHSITKSWDGEVRVDMRQRKIANGELVDWVVVTFGPHSDSYDRGHDVTLYAGPANGWQEYQERGELGRMAWNVEHGRKAA